MKSSNKTTLLLGIALVFTLAAAGAYAFLFVSMKDKTDATAEISSKTAELSGKESSMATAVSTLKSESANIEKLSSYFFSASDIVTFTKKIEALGQQSGTVITIESLEPGVTEKSVPFLNFRVKGTGRFADVERLLILLENFPGEFEWKTVRLIRDTGAVAADGKTKITTPVWSVDVFLSAHNFVN